MANTGVALNDEVKTVYEDMKLKKTHKYLVFKLTDDLKTIVIEHKGGPDAPYSDFVRDAFVDKACRYGVYLYSFDGPEGKREKMVFFLWTHDNSSVKHKMVYAGSKDTIKKALNGIQVEIQGTDVSEVTDQAVKDKCLSMK